MNSEHKSASAIYVICAADSDGDGCRVCVNLYLPARDSQMTRMARYRRIRQDQEVVLLDPRSWLDMVLAVFAAGQPETSSPSQAFERQR